MKYFVVPGSLTLRDDGKWEVYYTSPTDELECSMTVVYNTAEDAMGDVHFGEPYDLYLTAKSAVIPNVPSTPLPPVSG
jgi:hypothetical protein